MFIGLYKPKAVDLTVTRDRVKLRISEPSQPGRLWLNLTFDSKEELKTFIDEITFKLVRETDEYKGEKP